MKHRTPGPGLVGRRHAIMVTDTRGIAGCAPAIGDIGRVRLRVAIDAVLLVGAITLALTAVLPLQRASPEWRRTGEGIGLREASR